MGFSDDMTLEEARVQLRTLVREGHKCPVCTQFAKVYRRKINSGMCVSLISMWRAARQEWIHVPTALDARSREEGKLRYWGLVEESLEAREDGGRSGWWRVTPAGAAFARCQTRVPKYALVYDGRCLALEGEPVSVKDALGSQFDYAELMS